MSNMSDAADGLRGAEPLARPALDPQPATSASPPGAPRHAHARGATILIPSLPLPLPTYTAVPSLALPPPHAGRAQQRRSGAAHDVVPAQGNGDGGSGGGGSRAGIAETQNVAAGWKAHCKHACVTVLPCAPGSTLRERTANCDARSWLSRNMSFLWLHYLYFICLALIGGGVISAFETGRLPYMDALFMATSAACVTGLSVTDVSRLSLGSTLTLFVLMILGGTAFMSSVPVMIRRYYWYKHVLRTVPDEDERRRVLHEEHEYRALGWVVRLTLCLCLGWPIVCALVWGLYFQCSVLATALVARNGTNPWWWSFFHAFASYNNAGFSLFTDSFMQLADNYAVLLLSAGLILVGNVAYPIIFRLVVHILYTAGGRRDAGLGYLLDRPRKCYTHMFPAPATRILAGVVACTTLLQYFMFLILDYRSDQLAQYPGHVRSLISWYQSVSTRTAGFNVVDLAQTSAALQVIYLVMMYLSAYPVALAIRETGRREASKAREEAAERQRDDGARLEAALAEMDGLSPRKDANAGGASAKTCADDEEDAAGAAATGAGAGESPSAVDLARLGQQLSERDSITPGEAKHASHRSGRMGTPPHARDEPVAGLVTLTRGATSPLDSSTASAPRRRRGAPTPSRSARSLESYNAKELGQELELPGPLSGRADLVLSAESVTGSMTSIVSRDLVWLTLALIAICIAEQGALRSTPAPTHFNVFAIIFELVSAYGTVGLSLGYPDSAASLSGQLSTFSKFVVIAAMLGGRHRGLPFSIDAAVYLPTLLSGAGSTPPPGEDGAGSQRSFAAWSVAMLERGSAINTMRSLSSVFNSPSTQRGATTGGATMEAGSLGRGGSVRVVDGSGGGGGTATLTRPAMAASRSTQRLTAGSPQSTRSRALLGSARSFTAVSPRIAGVLRSPESEFIVAMVESSSRASSVSSDRSTRGAIITDVDVERALGAHAEPPRAPALAPAPCRARTRSSPPPVARLHFGDGASHSNESAASGGEHGTGGSHGDPAPADEPRLV